MCYPQTQNEGKWKKTGKNNVTKREWNDSVGLRWEDSQTRSMDMRATPTTIGRPFGKQTSASMVDVHRRRLLPCTTEIQGRTMQHENEPKQKYCAVSGRGKH